MFKKLLEKFDWKRLIILTLFFLFIGNTTMSQNNKMLPKSIDLFIEAINSNKVESVAKLLTENHVFTDAWGQTLSGNRDVKDAWSEYFKLFKDYKIDIEEFFSDSNVFILVGFASGTSYDPRFDRKPGTWRIPATFRAEIEGDLVSSWQVFADTKKPFQSIGMEHSEGTKAEIPDNHGIKMFGGVFFKAKDPKTLANWYDINLGTQFGKGTYTVLTWRDANDADMLGQTVFSIFPENSDYFGTSPNPFMFNFRVGNLQKTMEMLRTKGVRMEEKTESYDYGNFGWIYDPEGNKIELWEPKDPDDHQK
jgi:predicted enzyme related to lactoylglutathione lyase